MQAASTCLKSSHLHDQEHIVIFVHQVVAVVHVIPAAADEKITIVQYCAQRLNLQRVDKYFTPVGLSRKGNVNGFSSSRVEDILAPCLPLEDTVIHSESVTTQP